MARPGVLKAHEAEIAGMLHGGARLKDIADQFGVSHGSVGELRDRLGIPRRGAKQCEELSIVDAAYLAGIVDGEGCIWALTRGRSMFGGLAVGQADYRLIEFLLDRTGYGSVAYKPPKGNQREHWDWRVSYHEAVSLLEQLLPFLRLKTRQAELLVELSALKKANKPGVVPPEAVAIVAELKRLKKEPA